MIAAFNLDLRSEMIAKVRGLTVGLKDLLDSACSQLAVLYGLPSIIPDRDEEAVWLVGSNNSRQIEFIVTWMAESARMIEVHITPEAGRDSLCEILPSTCFISADWVVRLVIERIALTAAARR